jgi:hypothetical protein
VLSFDGYKLATNALTFGYNTSYYNQDNQISNYSAGNYLYVSGNSTGGTGGLYLQGAGNQKQAIIIDGNSSGGNIVFETNSSERMRLTSGGYLGIGTSSPSNTVQANGSIVTNTSGGYTQFQPTGLGVLVGAYGSNNTANLWLAGGTGNNGNQVGHYINSVMAGNGGGGGSASLQIGQIAWSGSAFTSGTAQVTLDSSGNLGIGTTNPTGYTGKTLRIDSSSGTIGISLSSGGTDRTFWYTENTGSAVYVGANSGYYAMYTNGSERVRIDTSGNLLVGTTSATATGLTVSRATSSNNGVGYFYNTNNASGDYCVNFALGSNTNNTSSFFLNCTEPGTANKFAIYGNGTYATLSDATLKKNIESTRDGYLQDLMKIRIVKYNWTSQQDGDHKELGLIAQELQQVFPRMVQETTEKVSGKTHLQVKSSVLPYILIKSMQELNAEIQSLKAEVATLKGA